VTPTKPPAQAPRSWRVLAQGPGVRSISLECLDVAFDEVVVGDWLHVEALDDDGNFYMTLGDALLYFTVTGRRVEVRLGEASGERTTFAGFDRVPVTGEKKARKKGKL